MSEEITAEEVKSFEGVELIYHYPSCWAGHLDSLECRAYVVKAELGVGITIMGPNPENPAKEVQLACYRAKNHNDETLRHFVDCIQNGEYFSDPQHTNTGMGGAPTCAF